MDKFISALVRITLVLVPILIAVLLVLGWALIFHPETLFKVICAGLGGIFLIAAAAVCVGLIRALVLCFKQ